MIPNEAIAAGLAAWGQCAVGVSPKQQITSILEAAAPHMLAGDVEAVEVMIKTAKANGWNEGYAAGMALQVPEPGA